MAVVLSFRKCWVWTGSWPPPVAPLPPLQPQPAFVDVAWCSHLSWRGWENPFVSAECVSVALSTFALRSKNVNSNLLSPWLTMKGGVPAEALKAQVWLWTVEAVRAAWQNCGCFPFCTPKQRMELDLSVFQHFHSSIWRGLHCLELGDHQGQTHAYIAIVFKESTCQGHQHFSHHLLLPWFWRVLQIRF